MRDLYEILGVDKSATKSDIKKAYKKKALEHHPDRGGDEEVFKEIAQAYEVLSNDDKKKRYDLTGSIDGNDGGGFNPFQGGFNMDDILNNFFGGDRHKPKGESINIQFKISLEEFFSGFTKTIVYNKGIPCEACECTGGKISACATCKGQGKVSVNRGHINMITSCSACYGTGKVIIEPCVKCDGGAYIMSTSELDIEVPKCSYNSIKFDGLGHSLYDGEAGDLIISLKIDDMCGFTTESSHLIKVIEIPYYDLILGSVIEVQTIEMTKIKVTIPKNSQPDVKLRVKEKGLYKPNSSERGDMFITLKPLFPDTLTLEDEKLLTELKNNSPIWL